MPAGPEAQGPTFARIAFAALALLAFVAAVAYFVVSFIPRVPPVGAPQVKGGPMPAHVTQPLSPAEAQQHIMDLKSISNEAVDMPTEPPSINKTQK